MALITPINPVPFPVNPTILGVAGVNVTSVKKLNPGHYMDSNVLVYRDPGNPTTGVGSNPSIRLTEQQGVVAFSGCKGWAGHYLWNALETSSGVINFNVIDNDLNYLFSQGKRLIICLEASQQGSTDGTFLVPSYVSGNIPTYGDCGDGLHAGYLRSTSTNASWANLSNSAVASAFANMVGLVAAHYDSNPNVEAIYVLKSDAINPDLGYSGVTAANYLAGLKTVANSMFSNSLSTNWGLSLSSGLAGYDWTETNEAQIVNYVHSLGGVLTGPDTTGTGATQAQDIYQGLFGGFPDLSTSMPYHAQTQQADLVTISGSGITAATPSAIFTRMQALKADHYLWIFLQGGPADWTSVIGPFIQNGAVPPTTLVPWNPGWYGSPNVGLIQANHADSSGLDPNVKVQLDIICSVPEILGVILATGWGEIEAQAGVYNWNVLKPYIDYVWNNHKKRTIISIWIGGYGGGPPGDPHKVPAYAQADNAIVVRSDGGYQVDIMRNIYTYNYLDRLVLLYKSGDQAFFQYPGFEQWGTWETAPATPGVSAAQHLACWVRFCNTVRSGTNPVRSQVCLNPNYIDFSDNNNTMAQLFVAMGANKIGGGGPDIGLPPSVTDGAMAFIGGGLYTAADGHPRNAGTVDYRGTIPYQQNYQYLGGGLDPNLACAYFKNTLKPTHVTIPYVPNDPYWPWATWMSDARAAGFPVNPTYPF